MHVLGILEIIVEVYFAVHAGKTGRHGWIFIILFFPIIGSLIYFFVEYLPEAKLEARSRKPKKRSPRDEVKASELALTMTDCAKNRVQLAKAYYRSGRHGDSIALLQESLKGVHADNKDMLEGLAYSYAGRGEFVKTIEILDKIESSTGSNLPNDLLLLKAKALESSGAAEKALQIYGSIANSFPSEEASCRYAMLLKRLGQIEKSKQAFAEILNNQRFIQSVQAIPE